MFRPVQLLSLLPRLCSPAVTSSASTISCRSASRGPGKTWSHVPGDRATYRGPNRASSHRDEMSDGEFELEDVEDKILAVVEDERRKQKKVKFHILRRQMTPRGPPERKLTWDAMEQIRYLKREQPEEWSVKRLAESFSVTSDVIHRVLRSKFIPSPERKAKQDAKILSGPRQTVLPASAESRLTLPGHLRPAQLPSGSEGAALVPAAAHTLMLRDQGPGALARSAAPVPALPSLHRTGVHKPQPVTTEDHKTTNMNPAEEEEDEKEEDEEWDGQVFTEEELEEFLDMKKPLPVIQVGNDFVDSEGNFLYRI